MLKDLARALSLANLCFISAWAELLDSDFQIPGFNQCVATMIAVLTLALVFFALITLVRRSRSALLMKIARLVFPLILLIPLNGILRILLPEHLTIFELVTVVLGIAMIAVSDIKPWNEFFPRSATAITYIMLPFFLITFSQAMRLAITFSERIPPPPVSARSAATPRIVWMVFDELGEQIAFNNRPETLQLPELDRFRSQSVYSINALPPAEDTLLSMPALINGKKIDKIEGLTDLMITYNDSEKPVNWKYEPNVFSRARESGINTAAIGWYLPYCRYIGASLTNCWYDDGERSLNMSLIKQFESLIGTIPLAPILESRIGITRNIRAKNRYVGVLEGAKRAVSNPDIGLTLVHWPVPHPPGFYDRHLDDFRFRGESSYLDNLRLADRSLGELRKVMEEVGTWDETIVLVTSDHAWRTDHWRSTYFWTKEDELMSPIGTDTRIPFMMKLAGQKQGLEYDKEFNTVLTHDLLLSLLKNEFSTPEGVVKWLDQHR